MDVNLSKLREIVEHRGAWHAAVRGVSESGTNQQLNNNVFTPNVAASVLQLLLEHGGNPNHILSDDNETIFEYLDFMVSYDSYMHRFFHIVQCWLVCMAYGACWQDNHKIPLTMLGGHTVEIFRDFRLYDYEIEYLPQEPGKFGCWIMHIFNTETGEEVARFE